MSRFVLDNTVTMAWCFPDEAAEFTETLLNRLSDLTDTALVPALWLYVVVNVTEMAVRKGRITKDKATAFIESLTDLPTTNQGKGNTGSGMSWRYISLLALLAVVVCVVFLFVFEKALFGAGPATIAIQIAAGLLMVWARLTFGRRSFHAAANPTAGGLVTRGPYRYLRHPIYAAILYFLWAGIAAHPSRTNILVALLASAALGVRMFAEERLLREEYPEYADYARRTPRVLPFLF